MTKNKQTKINNFITCLKKQGIFSWAEKLQKEFPRAEIYLVGGAVRDALLGNATKDYDFVIRNVPFKKLQKFLESQGWVELLGKNFGVLKFLPKKLKNKIDPIDIALPRTEHSILKSGAYKDFKVQSDHRLKIEEDLARRDFTVNALALLLKHPSATLRTGKNFSAKGGSAFGGKALKQSQEFKLVDKCNGLDDLENKIIRTVGQPEKRFAEDYSRMLRAIRFACQLDFEIDKKTKSAIKKMIKDLNKKSGNDFIIPREIIAKEFLRALIENPAKAFNLFDELNVFKILMPEILKLKGCKQPENYHTEGDVWQHTRLCLKMLDSKLFKEQFAKIITTPVGMMQCIVQCGKTTTQHHLYRTLQCNIPTTTNTKPYDSEVVLAVLLHDIEKPSCALWVEKKGEKRLQFYGHDTEGAKTAKKICERLKLSTPKEVGADCHNVSWLIKKHILLIHGKIDKMKPTKLEKYFLSENHPGEKLLKVTFADAISTIQKGRKIPEKKSDLKGWIALQGFKIAIKRIAEIKKLSKNKTVPPKPLLNGHEIMKILKLKPGYQIGKIKKKLRDAQLSGKVKNEKEAKEFLKNLKT